MSGLQCYTYICIENLYLCLVSFIIPTSGFSIFDLRHLYLFLVCNIIPTSVMANSAFAKLDFRLVIPKSGIGKQISSVISTNGAPMGLPLERKQCAHNNRVLPHILPVHSLPPYP